MKVSAMSPISPQAHTRVCISVMVSVGKGLSCKVIIFSKSDLSSGRMPIFGKGKKEDCGTY